MSDKIRVRTPADGAEMEIDADRFQDISREFREATGQDLEVVEIGGFESAGRGVAQGALAGFADEVAGAAGALGNVVGNLPFQGVAREFREGAGDAYQTARNEYRRDDEDAREAHPYIFGGGEVAGGIIGALGLGKVANATKAGAAAGAGLKSFAAPVAGGGRIMNALRSLAPAAAQGAAYGLVQGAGGASGYGDRVTARDADGRPTKTKPTSASQAALDLLMGAGTGGVIGGAAGGVVSGAGKVVSGVVGPAIRGVVQRFADSADTRRILSASGSGGTIARPRIIDDIKAVVGGDEKTAIARGAQAMRDVGVGPKIGSTRTIFETATEVNEKANNMIREVIEKADLSGQRVDVKKFAESLRKQAKDLETRPEMDSLAEALRARADQYQARFPVGATFQQAQAMVSDLGSTVNWIAAQTGARLPAAKDAAKIGTRAMRKEIDEAAARAFYLKPLPEEFREQATKWSPKDPSKAPATVDLGPDVEAYRAARRASAVSDVVKDAAEEALERDSKKATMGLGSMAAVSAGTQIGGSLGGAFALGARTLAWTFGSTSRATAAEFTRGIIRAAEADPDFARRVAAIGYAQQKGALGAVGGEIRGLVEDDDAADAAPRPAVDPRDEALRQMLSQPAAGDADDEMDRRFRATPRRR